MSAFAYLRFFNRLDRTLSATTDRDHFGDINEMIIDFMAAVKTRQPGLSYDGLEIPVIRLT